MASWFGPSLDGMKRCGPRTWQGWTVTAVLMGALGAVHFWFQPAAFGLPPWYRQAAMAGLAAAYLLAVCLTYDPDL
jgi:hypothetical protein